MKKIALVLVAAMVLVFTGCEKKETISMPFDVADVNNIEMYRNVVPNSAEKQVITKTDDIEDIYFLFSGLEVSVKAKLFCPEIAGLFCRIAGLFCHDSRANLSLKPVCFGIAIS